MSEDKIGKIAYIAKTSGIKFEGEEEWYNPTNTAKAYIKPELKGKEVTIRLTDDDPFKFSFIQVNKSSNSSQPVKAPPTNFMTKEEYWANKEVRDLDTRDRITRHGAINTAIEILKTVRKPDSTVTSENLLTTAEFLANKIVEYVENGNQTPEGN